LCVQDDYALDATPPIIKDFAEYKVRTPQEFSDDYFIFGQGIAKRLFSPLTTEELEDKKRVLDWADAELSKKKEKINEIDFDALEKEVEKTQARQAVLRRIDTLHEMALLIPIFSDDDE